MSKENGILFDVNLCVGCGTCYTRCKEVNNLPQTSDDPLRDHLSDNTLTVVEKYGDNFTRKMCMHCNEPACASVCLVGAIKMSPTGAVVYDGDKCIGCRYCLQACPHNIPRYEWSKTQPRVRKCVLCNDRVLAGGMPACAEICPTEATLYGDREKLIAIARQRMKDHPEKYYQKIYGLEDVGGSHVMVISPVPFEQLGYTPKLPKEPMPEFTMRAMEKIPSVVAGGGVFLTAMYWLTKRKNQIAREERNNSNGNKSI